MKKLMLLGGSRYILPVIKKAHQMGIYVITCDYLPDNIAHKYSDEYLNISIVDKDAVLEGAQNAKIDGIMSFACDPGVLTAAYVAEKMNLPGIGYEVSKLFTDKSLMRNKLESSNIKVIPYICTNDYNEAEAFMINNSFDVIVKPVDTQGSRGVVRVDTVDELCEAFENASTYSSNGKVLVVVFQLLSHV